MLAMNLGQSPIGWSLSRIQKKYSTTLVSTRVPSTSKTASTSSRPALRRSAASAVFESEAGVVLPLGPFHRPQRQPAPRGELPAAGEGPGRRADRLAPTVTQGVGCEVGGALVVQLAQAQGVPASRGRVVDAVLPGRRLGGGCSQHD